ncbi:MAG: hypothetical protein M3O30_00075 [Planctomycetota bacterium]|nr:hypothetical protein [Planctomycetota bacterium]
MRIPTLGRATAVSIGLILGSAAPMAWAAGASITYLDQIRSVSADANASDFSGTPDHHNDQMQAPGFDPFDGFTTETALVGAAGSGPTSTATGDQQSTLGPSGMTMQGHVQADSTFHANGSGSAVAESLFAVDFSIGQTSDFVLRVDLNSAPDLVVPGNSSISIELKDSKGNSLVGPVQDLNVSNFQKTAALSPGKYALIVIAQAKSNDESFNFINYTVGLSTTNDVVSTPLPGEPTAVPLPPALFTAGSLLVGLGMVARVRRRDL